MTHFYYKHEPITEDQYWTGYCAMLSKYNDRDLTVLRRIMLREFDSPFTRVWKAIKRWAGAA